MPVAIKDIIETADMPTGQGSPMWEGADWKRDSASVHALREAGAIILGKTTTTEFASSHPWHKTKNPHDPKRTPGGSSSGTAAAVGAGMVPAGLGTQVVGSILRPASFCGAVGFKPSVGAINRSGSHDHFSQSCQGSIGATLADTWAVLRAIADRTGGDPGYVGLSGDVDFTERTKPLKLAVLEADPLREHRLGDALALVGRSRRGERGQCPAGQLRARPMPVRRIVGQVVVVAADAELGRRGGLQPGVVGHVGVADLVYAGGR
jgi:Asp-tRNA(Asn)/Glu-tRNA(Gln) amidotransferase A subunit family amidase